MLLMPDQFDAWLKGAAGPEILQPAAENALREWIVPTQVNRVGEGDDGPALAKAATTA
ncbi:MAG: hypothetical protein INR62_08305 [Rhodospirillales bacterium]|nr:hypothetical protein [Acetobacter sp.]